MPNPVVHFEIHGNDLEALEKFYTDLFGWKTQSVPEGDYTLAATKDGDLGIDGGLARSDAAPATIFYVQVDDPQAYLDRAVAAGGKVLVPVTGMEMVTMARFADPQGNVIGLVKG